MNVNYSLHLTILLISHVNFSTFDIIMKQEAAALAATQVAFVLQSGQRRGLQFAIAPGPPTVNSQQEHV